MSKFLVVALAALFVSGSLNAQQVRRTSAESALSDAAGKRIGPFSVSPDSQGGGGLQHRVLAKLGSVRVFIPVKGLEVGYGADSEWVDTTKLFPGFDPRWITPMTAEVHHVWFESTDCSGAGMLWSANARDAFGAHPSVTVVDGIGGIGRAINVLFSASYTLR